MSIRRIRNLLPLGLLALALHAQPNPPPPSNAAPPRLYAVRLTAGQAWDPAKNPNEQAGMKEHSANIARIRREGLLVLGARFGEVGLIVLRVPDEPTARAQFTADPTIASGVFRAQFDVFSPFAHGTTAYLMTPEAIVLRAYLDAINRMDAAAVSALCAENFAWYSVDGATLKPEVTGREQLREWLGGYFRDLPTARTEFLALEQTGPVLTVRERATWKNKEGASVSQQAIGVYEVRDGLIQRAWYFPANRESSPNK